MDPITQGALGAAAAQVLLHRVEPRNAWIVGALAGMSADLDVLIRSSQDPMLFFIYHRQFTHSLMFIPIGGFLVALFLWPFQRFRRHWRCTLFAALIGYATHALLDACTSYGTVLFWPFSNARISWDVVTIVNPFVTFPLVLGLVWTIVFGARKGVLLGLFLTSIVIGLNEWQHQRAIDLARFYVSQHYGSFKRLRVFPASITSMRWRVVAELKTHYITAVVSTPFFYQGQLHSIRFFPVFFEKQLPAFIKNRSLLRRDYQVFHWFTDGYLIAVRKRPLVLIDARYLFGHNPIFALWGIEFLPNQKHVRHLHFVTLANPNQ